MRRRLSIAHALSVVVLNRLPVSMYSDARYRLRVPLMRSDVESCAAIEAVSYPAGGKVKVLRCSRGLLLVAPSCLLGGG